MENKWINLKKSRLLFWKKLVQSLYHKTVAFHCVTLQQRGVRQCGSVVRYLKGSPACLPNFVWKGCFLSIWQQFSLDTPFCRFEMGQKLSKPITRLRSGILQNCFRPFLIPMGTVSGPIFIKIPDMAPAALWYKVGMVLVIMTLNIILYYYCCDSFLDLWRNSSSF